MKKILSTLLILSALTMSGCAAPKPDIHTFNGIKECDLAWQRTQLKLASISTLNVVTDVLIQGTAEDSIRRNLPISAIRQNSPDGSCSIVIKASGSFGAPLTDNTL